MASAHKARNNLSNIWHGFITRTSGIALNMLAPLATLATVATVATLAAQT